MIPTLPQRTAELKTRLFRLHELSSKVEEASNLERLRQDLKKHVEKVEPQLHKQALLQAEDIQVPPPVVLVKAARRAAGLLEKFKAEPTAANLKKGQSWRLLLEELDTAVGELSQAVISAWRRARQSFFAGDTPSTLRGRLARTAENDQALERYLVLHQGLETAFAAAPSDRATVEQVRLLSKQLEAAAQDFNFDVPESVKAFLEAVQSVAGAPLDLFTPEVRDWLKANNSIDSYRITAKSRA